MVSVIFKGYCVSIMYNVQSFSVQSLYSAHNVNEHLISKHTFRVQQKAYKLEHDIWGNTTRANVLPSIWLNDGPLIIIYIYTVQCLMSNNIWRTRSMYSTSRRKFNIWSFCWVHIFDVLVMLFLCYFLLYIVLDLPNTIECTYCSCYINLPKSFTGLSPSLH